MICLHNNTALIVGCISSLDVIPNQSPVGITIVLTFYIFCVRALHSRILCAHDKRVYYSKEKKTLK